MEGRKVLVVCNLKAAKIVGFNSNGMVLAAKVRLYEYYVFQSMHDPELAPISHLSFFAE